MDRRALLSSPGFVTLAVPLAALTGAPLLGLASVVLYRYASRRTNIRTMSDGNID